MKPHWRRALLLAEKIFYITVILGLLTVAIVRADTPRDALERHADKMALKYGVSPVLLKSTCHIESNWQGGVSDKGARGICQLKPNTVYTQSCIRCYRTEADVARALDDPYKNIELATIHLRWLHGVLGDDESLIRAAYYAGTANDIIQYVIRGKASAAIYTTLKTNE